MSNYSSAYSSYGLDERTITPTSIPWVQVTFPMSNYGGILKNKQTEPYFRQTGSSSLTSEEVKGESYVATRDIITDLNISAPAPSARRGSITIADPDGVWAQIMTFVGARSNSSRHSGKSNMKIDFGWAGLKGIKGNKIETIYALMYKTNYSLSNEGITTIEIEFIENVPGRLSSLRFYDPRDMLVVEDMVELGKIHEMCEYLIENTSIKDQLEEYNIRITFEETYEDDAFELDADEFKIRMGDSFVSKINELIAKAVPPDKDNEDIVSSYEYDLIKNNADRTQTTVNYYWKETPADTTEPSRDSVDRMYKRPNMVEGPILLWKKQSAAWNEKTLISFDLDLKSMEYAWAMAQDEIDRILNQFDESDWETVQELIERQQENKELTVTGIPGKDNFNVDLGNLEERSGLFNLGSAQRFINRYNRRNPGSNIQEKFNELVEKFSSGRGVSAQAQAIINRNVFKAKATIIGDPAIGSNPFLRPYNMTFFTNLTNVGEFASYFNRRWLLESVTHRISESGFTTEIEIMGLPNTNVRGDG